jgi:hypothetical protein
MGHWAVLVYDRGMKTTARLCSILMLVAFAAVTARAFVEPVKVEGTWNVELQLESITGHPVVKFKQDGEKLTGTYEGRYGEVALQGTIKDKAIQFVVAFVAEGTQIQGTFTGTVEGDTMKGKVSYEGAGDGTWTATRAKADAKE